VADLQVAIAWAPRRPYWRMLTADD